MKKEYRTGLTVAPKPAHRFRLLAAGSALALVAVAVIFGLLDTQQQTVFELSFTESASSWGLNAAGSKDGGHSWGDYDLDGDLDLMINRSSDSRLYRNDGSNYTEVTSTLAPDLSLNGRERSAIWADFNHDGYPDFVRNTGSGGSRRIEIYLQHPATHVFGNGIGGTTPIRVGESSSDEVQVTNGINTEAVGAFDLEGDGDLDLYFDNHDYGIDILRNHYIDHLTGAVVNPAAAVLFSHATPGTSPILGLAQTATDGDYGSCADIDNDGWVDIATRKRDADDLYFNQGGTFANSYNVGQASNYNKGAMAFYDLDNDGDFDMIWTDNDGNRIFRRDGSAWTEMTTALPGIPTTGIDGLAGGDVDNDGDIDLFFTADNRSYLYLNTLNDGSNVGVGTPFVFSLFASSFNNGTDGEGASMVDIDRDGDLDIYLNIKGNNQLWINNFYDSSTPAADKRSLFVEVWDERSAYMQSGKRRLALGATIVLLDCQDNVISGLREVNGGLGHGTQDPSPVHFGLPYGLDYYYQVLVKYPMYNDQGTLVRQEVRKWVNPSLLGGQAVQVITTGTTPDPAPSVAIVEEGGGSQLRAQISGPIPSARFSFAWTGPGGFTSTNEVITLVNNGTYEVTCTYGAACSLSDQFAITNFPVEWLHVGISWAGSQGLLEWATASERQSDYFGIERSVDGQLFQELGRVPAAGNSDQIETYSFTDPEAGSAPQHYYRLRQVDLDGNFEYSSTVELNTATMPTELSLSLMPNPADGAVTIQIETATTTPLHLQVRAITGQLVYSQSVAPGQVALPTHTWPAGTYLVQLVAGHQVRSQRLVVQH